MSRAIWKYPLNGPTPVLEMPEAATVLHVGTQNDRPYLWAIGSPTAPKEKRAFHVYGTGHPIDLVNAPSRHVGTFFIDNGAYVFHVFDVGPVPEEF